MLLYPARVVLAIGILAVYVTLSQEFPVLMAKPLMLLTFLIASFCIYYSIESDPTDDAKLAAMPELDRKALALGRSKKANKIGLLLLVASLVAGYFMWPSLMRWLQA